jgi:hypothetical protein
MGSYPTLVHFHYLAYFLDLCLSLIRIIIGIAFRTSTAFRNPHAGVKRLTLRRMVDLEDRIPCHLLALETSVTETGQKDLY